MKRTKVYCLTCKSLQPWDGGFNCGTCKEGYIVPQIPEARGRYDECFRVIKVADERNDHLPDGAYFAAMEQEVGADGAVLAWYSQECERRAGVRQPA